MKGRAYKTIYYFDLSLYCACRGIKDKDGEPVRYLSPLSMNEVIRKFMDLSPAYKLTSVDQVDQSDQDNAEIEDSDESEIDVDGDVESVEKSSEFNDEDEGEESDINHYRPSRKYASGRLDVYLQDVKELDDCFVLLVNFTDLTSSHNVTRDTESGERTESNLAKTEGADLSTHIVVFKEVDSSSRQVCLVEKTHGLTNAVIKSFLDYLGKLIVENDKEVFEIDDPLGGADNKGKPKKRTIWPRFFFQGYPSDSFFDDIQNGYLKKLSLVGDAKEVKGIGEDIPEEFSEITIRIDANLGEAESVKSRMKRLLSYGKTYNLEKLRISFNDSSGAPHTREIDIDARVDDDSLEYIKKKRIPMAFRPMSSYQSVKMSFVTKMTGSLDD